MLYRTVQHGDTSPTDKKLRFYVPKHGFSRELTISTGTLFLNKRLQCFSRITLIGILAMSGCTLDHLNRHGQPGPQKKGEAAVKPMHKEVGEASWYGPGFQGKKTANGEIFDSKELTAAHPSLPMGTKAKVTNLENGKKVNVRINDRGPNTGGRVIDLSRAAAKKLDMKEGGTTQVKIETKPTKKRSSRRSRHTK